MLTAKGLVVMLLSVQVVLVMPPSVKLKDVRFTPKRPDWFAGSGCATANDPVIAHSIPAGQKKLPKELVNGLPV